MRVLSVASEFFPLLKTGGLADVAGALPGALIPFGVDMRPLLPAYPAVLAAVGAGRKVAELAALPGGPGRLRAVEHDGRVLYLLDAPQLFDRPGNPYVDATGTDWPDNGLRFAALAWAAARIGQGGDPEWRPAIVHCHDWQAGLAPAYLRLGNAGAGPSPMTVMTVHNLAFQGQFSPALLADLDLPGTAFRMDGLEYYGSLGFLKAGLYYADKLTTVSPTYALEIQTAGQGMGLDGLLRTRSGDLLGIVNGIDEDVWNPATDRFLPVAYDAARLERKAGNKRALQERLGLVVDDAVFLCSVVSRLSHQKGMDLLLEALPTLLAGGGQLALLGSGDAGLEVAFQAAAERDAGRVACVLGYDEPLSHLLQGGADAILVPSRFEPCGLTQLYGLRYGTLPIVARTGGLADTVIDASHATLAAGVADGLQFAPVTAEALGFALRRALELFRTPDQWRAMQVFAMRQPVGWQASAGRYADLYRALVAAGGKSGGDLPQ